MKEITDILINLGLMFDDSEMIDDEKVSELNREVY